MTSFDQFVTALVGQESGGNYRAVNGRTGALGKYQILPGNIGPWSRTYLGYSLTPQQFLNSPQQQDALARAVLRSYYNQYGPRGAAAAWYSGDPSQASNYHRFRPDEPSIGEYVDSVMSRAGDVNAGQASNSISRVIDMSRQASKLDELFQQPSPGGAAQGLADVENQGLGIGPADGGSGNQAADGSTGAGMTTGAGPSPTEPQRPPENLDKAFAALQSKQLTAKEREAVIEAAMQYIGTPYVYGGMGKGGVDCSGLMKLAFGAVGINLPRVSYDQLAMGKRTSVSNLSPGDFVGFGDGGHIALYLGNGQIFEAPRTGLNVRIRHLGSGENAWGVSLNSLYS